MSGVWQLREFEIDGGVRNVFDRAYPELVAGDVVSPGEPRTVYLRLRVRFGDRTDRRSCSSANLRSVGGRVPGFRDM